MMNRWNATIDAPRPRDGQPLVRGEQQHQRRDDLDDGASDVGHDVGDPGRPQVVREVAVVRPLDRLDGIHGLLETIGGTTLEKCWPNFETPAPTHTDHDQQLQRDDHVDERQRPRRRPAPGGTARPARPKRSILSRSPIATSSAIGAMRSAGLTRPRIVGQHRRQRITVHAGENSGMATPISSATYSATSNQVRRVAAGERHPLPRWQPDGSRPEPRTGRRRSSV